MAGIQAVYEKETATAGGNGEGSKSAAGERGRSRKRRRKRQVKRRSMQNGEKGGGRANRKKTVLPVPEQQVVSIYEFMMIPFCVRHGVVALQHSCAKRMVSAFRFIPGHAICPVS